MDASNKGLWISIEGTEGVGKSTLAKHLSSVFEKSIIAPEFSSSRIGEYLREAVQTSPHFISESLIEQSLLFLADFFRIYDTIVLPNIKNNYMVISDRGYVSKYVYQFLVLSSAYKIETTREMLGSLFRLIPGPDFILYLSCSESEQIRRLIQRDGHCDAARMSFIQNADREFEHFLKAGNFKYSKVEQPIGASLQEFLKIGNDAVKTYVARVCMQTDK